MNLIKKNKSISILLSIIPGLGQLYNGDLLKGLAFLSVTIIFAIEMNIFGISALKNFITLGSTPTADNSLFMMIEGALQIIICLVFILVFIVSVRDAKQTAISINKGNIPNRAFKNVVRLVIDKGFAYLLTVPAYIMMIIAIVFPVLVTICIAFSNYDFKHIPPAKLLDWVGFENFKNIFILSSYRATFLKVFIWTVIWTLVATTLQIALGIFSAILCHQNFVKLKRIFGVIFLLPWAVPSFITIMSFSNMFNDSAGAINTQIIPILNYLPFVNIGMIPWKTDPNWTKAAIIMVQCWLGFPYVYVLVTSILQSIPIDVYEAATIDGVNAWQRFTNITFPSIILIAAPTFITQYTGNFNNFSVIYLFNNGGPGSLGNNAGTTDILISWVYKMTTGGSPQYSVVASILLIISAVVIGVSMIVFKQTHALNLED
ncbi:MAG: sugar ABC transporter permease [Clostridiales bacterium]|nr:sugar ABC transporter permease [Clostridiales bacterium]